MQRRLTIVDSAGNVVDTTATESGRAVNIYQSQRNDSGYIHFDAYNLSAGTYKFVLIDISDTENYNHGAGTYAHLETREISVVCDVNGEWIAEVCFIENVTASGSVKYVWNDWEGAKDTGNRLDEPLNMFPVGPHMRSDFITTGSPVESTEFKSDIPIPSTLDSTTANIYPGEGDVVLNLIVSAGTVRRIRINLAYHSH